MTATAMRTKMRFVGEHPFLTLPDSPVVVDAGACLGAFAANLSKSEGTASPQLFLIEASERLCKYLGEYVVPEIGATLARAALLGNSQDEPVEFCTSEVSLESGFAPAPLGIRELPSGVWQRETVPALGVNDLFDRFNIDHIDLLKLDIEGAERPMLEAMTADTASRISQITLEVHPWAYSADAVVARLTQLGYAAVTFCGRCHRSGGEQVLGVRHEYLKQLCEEGTWKSG